MRDWKMVTTTDSRKTDNFTLSMLAASTAAFWCANIYVMFEMSAGYVAVKLVAQCLAWLHTICFIRAFDE